MIGVQCFFSFWVLLYNLSFISLVLMSVLSGYWSQALLWWVFKILLDITVYIPWFFRWRKWRMACVMPLLSITYPYYLIVLGLGYLFADVQWKKRPLRV
jgi:hypothetical protein